MKSDRSITAVIFSKDRTMQLDACLRSFALYCKDIQQCYQQVIYTTSHERSERQYEILRKSYGEVAFIKERSFHVDLSEAMEGFSHILFLVDDNVFVREWSFSEAIDALARFEDAIGFSLRLGSNISFSYSLGKSQQCPEVIKISNDIVKFSWVSGKHDFGYPLEVSSSLYRAGQIRTLVKASSTIANPNSLEAFLDANKDQFRQNQGDLLCFSTSVAFCNPVNVVQTEWLNRSRSNYNESVCELIRKFDLGYRIDLSPFRNFVPHACHQEVELSFVPSPAEWASVSASIELKSPQEASKAIFNRPDGRNSILASSSLHLSDLSEADRDRVCELICLVKKEGATSDWLTGVLRMLDEVRRADSTYFHAATITFKEQLAKRNEQVAKLYQLKEEWYEPELARLEREIIRINRLVTEYETHLAHLRAELDRFEHRLVIRLRHAIKSRWPRVSYYGRRLIERGLILWNRQRKIFEALRAISNVRVVSNSVWPTTRPLVSVVIASFNYGKYLHETIDSVLAQTFQDFEIIVIDDGSTDPYTQEVLSVLDKPKTQVVFQSNQGLPTTRNNGIKIAQGKYICCLDSDDCLTPTYLEKCVYHLETRNLDVSFSWVQTFGESTFLWETGPFLIDVLMKLNSVSVSAVFKKACWELVGGYKEAMTHGYDDWEFWLTLAEYGALGDCIPEPLMLHRKHPTSMSAGRKHRYDSILEDIKVVHRKLFQDPSYVKRIRKQQRRTFTVRNPLCNLERQRHNRVHPPKDHVNVLMATPWFDLSGPSVVKRDVFTRLAKEGIRVTAIAGTEPSGSYTENGVPLYEAITKECFNLPRFLGNQNKHQFVQHLIQSRGIQVLYLAGCRAVYEMLPELKKTFPDLKVVDELYNIVGHIDSNREFRKCIDLNVAINQEVVERLVALGESRHRIEVITPGIDVDHFSPRNPVFRESASHRPYNQFTFGFLGRLSPEKRPQDFVQLAGQLSSCQFRIAGDGPLTASIAGTIIEQGISDRCHFEGWTRNSAGFLAGIDALIITSEVEGLPLVLLEAMALELPVIATTVGEIPRVVVHGRNGFLYKAGYVDELMSLADLLSRMPDHDRKAIGKSARETVCSEHTVDRCAAKYLTAFKSLILADRVHTVDAYQA
jgi:glycosyltransferase involved in cell wall biosynthesis